MFYVKVLKTQQKNQYYNYFQKNADQPMLLSYKGGLTHASIAKIGRHIRKIFENKPKISRKVFSIFIELAQNVANYSSEKNIVGSEECVGSIVLLEEVKAYVLCVGNLLSAEAEEALEKRCDYLNNLSYEELRKERVQRPVLPKQKHKEGAGIGLLKVVLLAKAPIYFESHAISEEFSFIILSTKIAKNLNER